MTRIAAKRIEVSDSFYGHNLAGMTVAEAKAALGKSHVTRIDWPHGTGYRIVAGRMHPIKSINEVEDEINARTVTLGPCFRCGCRECCCRGSTT